MDSNIAVLSAKVERIEQDLQSLKSEINQLKSVERSEKYLTATELGLSDEDVLLAKNTFSTFADDWNDPEMDVYDAVFVPKIRKNLANQKKKTA